MSFITRAFTPPGQGAPAPAVPPVQMAAAPPPVPTAPTQPGAPPQLNAPGTQPGQKAIQQRTATMLGAAATTGQLSQRKSVLG